jgi:hypothetical protein
MTFILVIGIRLRLLILGYLLEPDTKIGAINLLIWIDQVFIATDCKYESTYARLKK